MLVKDIMTKKIIYTTADELLSQVLSKMQRNNVHQLPVLDGNKLKAMITLNDIIKREYDPTSTKVSAVMTSAPKIEMLSTAEQAAELVLNSNVRALPVIDREDAVIGIVSETDLIASLKFSGDVKHVVKDCMVVTEDDSVGKIKRFVVQKNLSRVPVVKSGKLVGVVGTMELAKLVSAGKAISEARGWGLTNKAYKEKMNVDTTSASTIMRKPAVINKNAKLSDVITLLKKNEEVFIEDGGLKIITPKDVLQLSTRPKKTLLIQIAGLENEDSFTVAKLHKIIEDSLKTMSRATEIQPFHIFIEHHKKLGERTKYSFKAQLHTQIGKFVVSKVWGFNLITVSQEAMANIEREFWRKYEKVRGKDKSSRRAGRGK
jgi:CBS domain-containing protein